MEGICSTLYRFRNEVHGLSTSLPFRAIKRPLPPFCELRPYLDLTFSISEGHSLPYFLHLLSIPQTVDSRNLDPFHLLVLGLRDRSDG